MKKQEISALSKTPVSLSKQAKHCSKLISKFTKILSEHLHQNLCAYTVRKSKVPMNRYSSALLAHPARVERAAYRLGGDRSLH